MILLCGSSLPFYFNIKEITSHVNRKFFHCTLSNSILVYFLNIHLQSHRCELTFVFEFCTFVQKVNDFLRWELLFQSFWRVDQNSSDSFNLYFCNRYGKIALVTLWTEKIKTDNERSYFFQYLAIRSISGVWSFMKNERWKNKGFLTNGQKKILKIIELKM